MSSNTFGVTPPSPSPSRQLFAPIYCHLLDYLSEKRHRLVSWNCCWWFGWRV